MGEQATIFLTFLWNYMMTCIGLQHASLPCFCYNLRWHWASELFFSSFILVTLLAGFVWLLCHVLRMRTFLLSLLTSMRTLSSLWYAVTWSFFIKCFFLMTPGRLLPCCWTLPVRWQLICTSWTAVQYLYRDGKLQLHWLHWLVCNADLCCELHFWPWLYLVGLCII